MPHTMVNSTPTLAQLFREAMRRHDAAEAAGDDEGMDVNSGIIDVLSQHGCFTPARDIADVAHRIGAAVGMMGRIYSDAESGHSVSDATLLVECLLATAMDGLEDFTGFRREDYRLDYYATRMHLPEQEAA
jgi:hypothetical protein